MKIELNAVELEAAVIAHLTNSGLDMKKKDITFEFEGTCSLNIEDQDSTAAKKTPTKRTTRKSKTTTTSADTANEEKAEEKPKAKPKAAKKEEVKEEEEAVAKDTVQKPVADTPDSAEDLFSTPKAETETESDTDTADEDTSLFG